METFSALLTICAGNSPITGEFPAQRPVTRCFDVSFDILLNKRLSKQWWGWLFETPSRPLWRHCNDIRENRERVKMYIYDRILWFCYDLVLPNFTYISNVTMAIAQSHYSDVIMWAMASQITCVSIVCSTVLFFRRRSKKTSKRHVAGLCEGNPPVTCGFPSWRFSNAERASIWWSHHGTIGTVLLNHGRHSTLEGKCRHFDKKKTHLWLHRNLPKWQFSMQVSDENFVEMTTF